jgi:hypothetical protein
VGAFIWKTSCSKFANSRQANPTASDRKVFKYLQLIRVDSHHSRAKIQAQISEIRSIRGQSPPASFTRIHAISRPIRPYPTPISKRDNCSRENLAKRIQTQAVCEASGSSPLPLFSPVQISHRFIWCITIDAYGRSGRLARSALDTKILFPLSGRANSFKPGKSYENLIPMGSYDGTRAFLDRSRRCGPSPDQRNPNYFWPVRAGPAQEVRRQSIRREEF